MEQEKKEVDATLDSFADSGVEIPQSHWVIQENVWFIGSMAKKVRKGEWTMNDVKEFLESRGYKRETVNRFVHAVTLQLRERQTLASKDSPPAKKANPTPKPARSEGSMTPEVVEKVKDPEARRLAKEYLDETEAPTTVAKTSPSAVGDTTNTKETSSTTPGRKAKGQTEASKRA